MLPPPPPKKKKLGRVTLIKTFIIIIIIKSGSTMVYQVHQAFNQTFGARVTFRCLEHSVEIIIHNL